MESHVSSPPESNPPQELDAGANEALARIGENVLLGEQVDEDVSVGAPENAIEASSGAVQHADDRNPSALEGTSSNVVVPGQQVGERDLSVQVGSGDSSGVAELSLGFSDGVGSGNVASPHVYMDTCSPLNFDDIGTNGYDFVCLSFLLSTLPVCAHLLFSL